MKKPRCSMRGEPLKCRSLAFDAGHRCPEKSDIVRLVGYMPIQLVAPSAVRMADAIEAIS